MLISSEAASNRLREIFNQVQPERIVLHAGRVKTGSTFLQAALMENTTHLLQSGWVFPQSLIRIGKFQHETRSLRTAGHALLADIGAGRPVSSYAIDRFREEIVNKKGYKILFSTEILGRDHREENLFRLARAFGDFNFEIFMYLRRPSEWINSYYIEQVTGGNVREYRSFEQCFENLLSAAQATPFLEQCRSWPIMPKVTFRNYNLARSSDAGLLGDFCEKLQLPKMREAKKAGVNLSPGYFETRAIRAFNASTRGLSGDDYRALYAVLLERLAKFDSDADCSFLDPTAAEVVDRQWAHDNQEIVLGCCISQDEYDALTAPTSGQNKLLCCEVEAQILNEVCDLLVEGGVNGFKMKPTVRGVAAELRRLVADRLRYRIKRMLEYWV